MGIFAEAVAWRRLRGNDMTWLRKRCAWVAASLAAVTWTMAGCSHPSDSTIDDGIATTSALNAAACTGSFYVATLEELQALSGCEEITGDLYLHGSSFTDLLPLAHLQRVTGFLHIIYAHSLPSLHGLEALTTVGGALTVELSEGLTNIAALSGLREVGGAFTVGGNALTEWPALPNLVKIGGLSIYERKLQRIAGFSALREIGGDFSISNNEQLTEFEPMPLLTTVRGVAQFEYDISLKSVAPFENVRELGGLRLALDAQLESFRAFPNATAIHGPVLIKGPKLSDIDLRKVKTIEGPFQLTERGDGLPALTSLRGFSSLESAQYLIIEGPVGFTNFKGLEKLTTVEQFVNLEGAGGLVDFRGLENLTTTRSFSAYGIWTLQSLRGLDKLGSGPGQTIDVSVGDNGSLTEIGSLNALTETSGGVSIYGNGALRELNGLHALRTAGSLNIGNASLKELNGLESLTRVTGSVFLLDNPMLESLDELGSLAKIDGYLTIRQMGVRDLGGLASLTSVGGGLTIGACPNLESLDGLDRLQSIGYGLEITSNPKLEELDALRQLSKLGFSLTVANNAALPPCQPTALVTRLQDGGYTGTVEIHDNGGTGTCD